ncbi:MAG: MCE family protein, partial [Aeromicrobium sp.]
MRSPYRVGLAGGAVLLVMALFVGYLSSATIGKAHYTGYLEHTAGLRVSEDVQVAGVSVGEITGISLDDKKVRIEFTVDKKIRLGSRTTAAVKVATLLGTHYLEIDPTGPGALNHSTIPLAQTSVPFNLQDVIEDAGTSLQQYDSKKLSQSFTVMADALRGTPEATRRALIGVSDLSKVAADRSEQMRTLLASARAVTGELARNSKEIITLLKQSNL